MTWDDFEVRVNWRDDTGTAVATADDPVELDRVDRLMDAWAASDMPFAEFLATMGGVA